MFSLVISLITQPWTLIALAAGVAAAVAYGYFAGWPKLLKVALDFRTWVVIAAAVFVIGSANLKDKVEVLQEQVKTEQVEADSFADANDVLTDRAVNIRTRAGERQRITEAQIEAPPGEELDAVLDAIAVEDQRRADDGAGA